MRDETDPVEFLKELEERRGGKIRWRTFSTWFSDGTNVREFGVFLYEINGILYYEDFERRPTFLGFQLPLSKNAPKYVKLEGSFEASRVKRAYFVPKRRVLSFLNRPDRPQLLAEANLWDRIFRQLLTVVEIEDGKHYFFEFLNLKEFRELVQRAKLSKSNPEPQALDFDHN